ncbi:MAG: cytochrome c biogenesis protein CcsA [bacterium]
MFNANNLGDLLLHGGIAVAVFAAVASVVGRVRGDGRLMLAGERAGLALTGLMICASLLLVDGFLGHDYNNKYVAHYSDNNMPWYYLIASFWGGQAGSLMFWSLVLAVCTGIVIWQNRDKNRDILPTVITVLMAVQIFFLALMVLEANPFEQFQINEPPPNGRGLEPLLQNPAMTFHPPSILSGYVWFTVPFAFAVAAIVHRRLDSGWIRTTRRYAVVSWAFLSIGNLFGGMWAYQELGWGGFWGWDPVENASLMPWIAATAYLHSVMIQERRGLLKVWNLYLVVLTYFLTVFGTFLTRSGLIDSVHTFAQSDVGDYFMVLLSVLTTFSMALLGWRILDGSLAPGKEANDNPRGMPNAGWYALAIASPPALMVVVDPVWAMLACGVLWVAGVPVLIATRLLWASKNQVNDGGRIDNLLSREGIFLLNNFVLLGCVGVVMFGTLGEKISDYFWQQTKYTATWFNAWMVPGGIALLLLMGIGPLIPWRKATRESLQRNFLVPTVLSLAGTALLYATNAFHLKDHVERTTFPIGDVPLARLLIDAELTGVYALIGFFGVIFVTYTMVLAPAAPASGLARRRIPPHGPVRSSARTAAATAVPITHIGFEALPGLHRHGHQSREGPDLQRHRTTEALEDKLLTFKGLRQTENREYRAVRRLRRPSAGGGRIPGRAAGESLRDSSRRSYHGANVKMSRPPPRRIVSWRCSANVYLALVSSAGVGPVPRSWPTTTP